MEHTKEEEAQEIIDRIRYRYTHIDGEIVFPNTFDGDVLKIAYRLAYEVLEDGKYEL